MLVVFENELQIVAPDLEAPFVLLHSQQARREAEQTSAGRRGKGDASDGRVFNERPVAGEGRTYQSVFKVALAHLVNPAGEGLPGLRLRTGRGQTQRRKAGARNNDSRTQVVQQKAGRLPFEIETLEATEVITEMVCRLRSGERPPVGAGSK